MNPQWPLYDWKLSAHGCDLEWLILYVTHPRYLLLSRIHLWQGNNDFLTPTENLLWETCRLNLEINVSYRIQSGLERCMGWNEIKWMVTLSVGYLLLWLLSHSQSISFFKETRFYTFVSWIVPLLLSLIQSLRRIFFFPQDVLSKMERDTYTASRDVTFPETTGKPSLKIHLFFLLPKVALVGRNLSSPWLCLKCQSGLMLVYSTVYWMEIEIHSRNERQRFHHLMHAGANGIFDGVQSTLYVQEVSPDSCL